MKLWMDSRSDREESGAVEERGGQGGRAAETQRPAVSAGMYGCEKRPPLIAKSPSSEGASSSKRGRSLLLAASNLQAVSGLLMLVFGVLCAAYGSSLSRLGGGLWGGLTALGAGAIGTAAALRPRRLHQTLYLALCLVSLAVNTLVLLLTLTATVKDSRFDNHDNLHVSVFCSYLFTNIRLKWTSIMQK